MAYEPGLIGDRTGTEKQTNLFPDTSIYTTILPTDLGDHFFNRQRRVRKCNDIFNKESPAQQFGNMVFRGSFSKCKKCTFILGAETTPSCNLQKLAASSSIISVFLPCPVFQYTGFLASTRNLMRQAVYQYIC